MRTKPVTIIEHLEQLQRVDLKRLCQSLDYSEMLEFGELKMALRLQSQKQLQAQLKKLTAELTAEFAQQRHELLAHNQQLLEAWEQQQQLTSQLQSNVAQVVAKLASLLGFKAAKVDFLVNEILTAVGVETLAEQKLERDLRIKVASADYAPLVEHLGAQLNLAWLAEFVIVDASLAAGVALVEDKFTRVEISITAVEQKIMALFQQLVIRE